MTPEVKYPNPNFFDRHLRPSLQEPVRIYGAKRGTIKEIQKQLPERDWKFGFDPKSQRFFAQQVKPGEDGHVWEIIESLNTHF